MGEKKKSKKLVGSHWRSPQLLKNKAISILRIITGLLSDFVQYKWKIKLKIQKWSTWPKQIAELPLHFSLMVPTEWFEILFFFSSQSIHDHYLVWKCVFFFLSFNIRRCSQVSEDFFETYKRSYYLSWLGI